MDTQNLTQRAPTRDEQTTMDTDTTSNRAATGDGNDPVAKAARQKKLVIAKQGLKTMLIAITIPLLLNLTNIYFFGTNNIYKLTTKPTSWVPPVWAIHLTSLVSGAIMGLCGWIVWAEGGFHRKNNNTIELYYLGQLGLSLLWDPVVFKLGSNGVGFLVVLGVFYGLLQCYWSFKKVNQIAGDLVLPCLAWAGLLGFVNLKLLLS